MTRGGILASSAAVALIVAGAFGLRGRRQAQAKKREAPLELKDDASVRPWKRYPGWPARDESKCNTLANLALAAGAESAAQARRLRSPAMRPTAPSWWPTATAAARASPAT